MIQWGLPVLHRKQAQMLSCSSKKEGPRTWPQLNKQKISMKTSISILWSKMIKSLTPRWIVLLITCRLRDLRGNIDKKRVNKDLLKLCRKDNRGSRSWLYPTSKCPRHMNVTTTGRTLWFSRIKAIMLYTNKTRCTCSKRPSKCSRIWTDIE